MDFNDISHFFGGSIFAEEYRGDFRQIEAEIQRIEYAHSSHTLQGLAQRCLLKGLFEMLRGEYGTSQVYLDEIRQHEANLDDKWKARLRLYERLNLIFRLTPPLIRFRSNLGGSASTIHECEIEAQRKLAAPIPLYQMTSTVEMCEFQVLQQLHSVYIATWISSSLHPRFAHAGLKGAAEARKALLYDIPPAQMLNILATSELGAIHAYYTRLKCEINFENLQVEPAVAFANVRNMYLRTNDYVGMACYHILIGDRIVSPPFTSPVALNLITEGHLLGWENDEWDKAEPSFCLTQNEEADRHYSTALGYVHGIAAPRVRGAIALRRACTLHMTAVQSVSNGNREEADALFSDAAVNLYSAEDDFFLDESHLQIISCHKLLLDISRGDHLLLEDRAAEIGAWGKSSGNTALAQFLGIMMMRFGRRLFLDHGRVDLSQLSLNCAKACFHALGDEIYILQSTLADAQLKHGSGNFVAAQVAIDTVRKETQALNHLRELASRSMENADALGMPIANLFTGYDRIVSNIYSSANDANAIQSWREEYRRLKSELKIARTLAKRSHLQSVPAGSAAPLSDASGRPIDAEELLDEAEAASDLMGIYNDYMSQAYAALDQADVEGFNRCIERYLAESTRTRRAEDIRLTHHIIAYTVLCNYEKACELLPQAIESTFGGCAKSLVASELRNVRFEGLSISNDRKIDFNAAERAISLCYISHDWKRGHEVLAEVEQAFPDLLKLGGPNLDRTQWKFGVYVACIWEHNDVTDKAFSWYLWSFQSLQTQRAHVEDPDARRGMGWSIHHANLFAGLTRMSLQFWRLRNSEPGQKGPLDWGLTAPDWLVQAMMFMEDSFARTLLELIIARDETSIDELESWSSRLFLIRQINDLKALERTQRKLVTAVEDEIFRLKPSDRSRRNELDIKLQKRSRDLKNLGKDIKKYEDSLRELERLVGVEELSSSLSNASHALLSATQFRIDTSTIFTAIALDTAVIELNTSRGGLIILGITRKGIEVAHQSPINELELRKPLFSYIKALRDKGVRIKNSDLATKLTTVSEMILEPLHELLEQVDHVIFVPSSIFMSFPFGCLLYKKEPLIIRKAVSQVPSLAVLERLVKLDEKRQERHPGKPKLFTIVNSHQETKSEVPTVVFGALSLYRSFGTPPSTAEALDEAQFATEYRDATIVHVGTHGYQSALSPWQSYLSLAKQFKVMELAKLKTNASLVVFCACLSGLGRVTNGNDVLGFSHAVLQSGAQVYMGALWEVSELETLILMILFYRKLAVQGVSIAKAWQHAQVSLYNMTKEMALQMLKESMADWDHAEQNGINPDRFVNNGKEKLDQLVKNTDWDEEHFKNPYYWASFSLIGNAGIFLRRPSD
ncbi:CHAT domain-containing protein [Hyaloscypha finlandica]|nr:CHAT domain-containing protein [Hyaloscypha finlandica]